MRNWSVRATPVDASSSAVALATLALALTLMITAPRPGWAHATIVTSEPADRSVVAAAPETFALTFNEPVTPLVLRLLGGRGSVLLDRYQAQGRTLVVRAPASLDAGTYRLSWRIVSTDGHPVAGSILFVIGSQSPGGVPEAEDAADPRARAALWIGRLAIYVGLFFGVGGAFFCAWIDPSRKPLWRARRFLLASLLLGLVATPLSVGLLGLDAFGAPLAQLAKPIVWQTGFDTSWGLTASIGLFGVLVSLGAVLACGQTSARVLTLLGLCSVGLALAASGHASTASPQLLTRPAVFLHAIGLALWTGALAPLAAAMRDEDRGLAALRRFSRSAPAVVAVIIVSGTVLAVVQLGSVSALWTTDYGRVLLGKLGVVVALFAIAVWNRAVLTPRITRGQRASRRRLVRTITAELVLVTLVFALATTWRFTPPPRGLAAAAAAPASLHLHTTRAAADVTVTPARAGRVSVTMVIMSADLGALDAQEVRLTLANPGAGVEPITRPAYKPGDGTWRVDAVTIPLPGLWSVRLDILMPDASTATLEDAIEIRP